jgi:hypothetical protein
MKNLKPLMDKIIKLTSGINHFEDYDKFINRTKEYIKKWHKQQMKELIESVPNGLIAGGKDTDVGYNQAMVIIKEWEQDQLNKLNNG